MSIIIIIINICGDSNNISSNSRIKLFLRVIYYSVIDYVKTHVGVSKLFLNFVSENFKQHIHPAPNQKCTVYRCYSFIYSEFRVKIEYVLYIARYMCVEPRDPSYKLRCNFKPYSGVQ